jgi:hypothetical protein
MTAHIAHCIRCGVPRTINKTRDGGLCIACSYDAGHRCQRCGKPRGRHNHHPELCGPCTREQGHTIALEAGQWVRDGLVWRWQPDPQEVPQPIRCGTYRGYRKHRRTGEPACAECREAFRIHRREERRQEAA